jgi:hypothetical protein
MLVDLLRCLNHISNQTSELDKNYTLLLFLEARSSQIYGTLQRQSVDEQEQY